MKTRTLINRILQFLIVITCLCTQAQAKLYSIREIRNSKFISVLRKIDKDTIILIAVDGVITTPKSSLFAYKSPHRNLINNMVRLGRRSPKYNEIVASWYQQRDVKLLESGWPKLITEMKERGAKVFGILKMPIKLINIEEKILWELNNFGINFDNQMMDKTEFLIKKNELWPAKFYKGLIVTGSYSITNIVMEFLRLTYIPKQLIVVSHLQHESKNTEKKLRVFNMDNNVVHYQAIKKASPAPNDAIAKFQQEQLVNNQKWYEDDEARRLLGVQ